MKVGILAGGKGSRLSEETVLKPKPMVEIGGQPILWHIMMIYAAQGFDEFAIALGYKGEIIERYVRDSLASNREWKVDLIDTGEKTHTGGRIKRLANVLGDETFMLTWSDGLAPIDLQDLLRFHRRHGRLATVTAVHPPPRFGHIELDGDRVARFSEKPLHGGGWINGAFFVLEPGIFDYIDGDATSWEQEPMERLAADGQLMAYRHEGFWQCMDTLHDKMRLETLWESGEAPWKIWDEGAA